MNAVKDGGINYAGLQGEHIQMNNSIFPIWTNAIQFVVYSYLKYALGTDAPAA